MKDMDQKALEFHVAELRRIDVHITLLRQQRNTILQKIEYYRSRAVRR